MLREIIQIEHKFMGNNFVPSVLEELAIHYDGAPLVMAYGLPVSGKSLAVSIAMALIGDKTSIGG